MSCYWAKFELKKNNYFRFDTRVYLKSIPAPTEDDFCIGAIAGKNPGSASPSIESKKLQKIDLDGDKLLPTVRSIFSKAYKNADQKEPSNGYIQVLNLIYLCDKNLSQALNTIQKYSENIIDPSEKRAFDFLWYVWGGNNKRLNKYKNRFRSIKAKNNFYFNNATKAIVDKYPSNNDKARHTQGLKHACVIPYISKVIQRSAIRSF